MQHMPIINKNIYNWKRDPADARDFETKRHLSTNDGDLPSEYTGSHVGVYDQGVIGSCTANAFAICYKNEMLEYKTANPSASFGNFEPSRLFIYYVTRAYEGTVDEDSGAYIRDVFKVMNKIGACDEARHPYNPQKFRVKPSDVAFREALDHTIIEYAKVPQTVAAIKKVLVSNAFVEFGFDVYDSFDTGTWHSTTGMMPIPNVNTESLLGGHAVSIVGYSNKKKAFLIQNSWGESWGQKGKFWMPYKFVTSKSCSDFWVIEKIRVAGESNDGDDSKKGRQSFFRRVIEYIKSLF